jgi:hypothetical protein
VVAVGGFALLQVAGSGTPGMSPGSSGGPGPSGGAKPSDAAPTDGDLAFDPMAGPEEIPPGPAVGEYTATAPVESDFIDSPWGSIPGNTWWVMLSDGRGRADAEAILAKLGDGDGATIAGHIEFINAWQLRIPAPLETDGYLAAYEFLGKLDGVAAVSPEAPHVLKGCADEVSQGDYAAESGAGGAYSLVGVDAAWAAWYASRLPKHMVHAAVVDTPISKAPSGRPYEFDNVSFDGDPATSTKPGKYDGFYHADGVMGIFAGDAGDGGIAGIASPLGGSLVMSHYDWTSWHNAAPGSEGGRLSASDTTSSFAPEMMDALAAVNAGATIVNLSVGPAKPGAQNAGESAMWREFATTMAARHPEVLFVVAAGNEASTLDGRNYGLAGIKAENVITVGNVDNANAKVIGRGGSNYLDPAAAAGDAEITIAAPGDQSVWGTGTSGKLMRTDNGTSSATPMVAATAALIRSVNPSLTAKQIKELIVAAGQSGPADLGGKTLSVDRAVRAAIDLQLLASRGKALTDEEIAAVQELCQIAITGDPAGEIAGKPGYQAWKINASLPVVPAPTVLTLTIKGGLRPTDWRKPVSSPADRVSWNQTAPPEGIRIVVTRQDIGFWRTYLLKGTAAASPTPGITTPPTPTPTPPPTPGSSYDCSNPPPSGTIAYVQWSLHCKPIGP